jgi:hypothetical protein
MDHHRGGNVFIWTLLWLIVVMAVVPVFVNGSVLIIRHQQLMDAMDSALEAVQSQSLGYGAGERMEFAHDLQDELPQSQLQVISFSDTGRQLEATVQCAVVLPISVGRWNNGTIRGTLQIY